MNVAGDPLRAAYETESRVQCQQTAWASCWLGLPLIALFGGLESFSLINAPALFPWLRLGCGAVIVGVLAGLRAEFGRRHPGLLFLIAIAAIGQMLALMMLSTGREESPYFVGIALAMLSAAMLMPWPPLWSVATAAALLASYAVTSLVTGPSAARPLFVSNCALLLATGAIAVTSTALRERLRWREFCNRTALVVALEHRRDFMAKMSHELRTPLHVIIGYADILLDELLPADGPMARDLVDRSRSCAVSLHGMINDLLDYAKAEAGKLDIRREPVHVGEVVEQMVGRFHPLSERKGIALTVSCDAELPEVLTDRQRLEQILVNLIGNAVKFTGEGGVSVEVCRLRDGGESPLAGFRFLDAAGGTANVPGRLAGPQLAILVRDTGMGIREDDLARLAEDFQQVDTGGQFGGTGLGLSISRKLASLLGGRIAVHSRYAEGSTFALLLPATGARRRAAA